MLRDLISLANASFNIYSIQAKWGAKARYSQLVGQIVFGSYCKCLLVFGAKTVQEHKIAKLGCTQNNLLPQNL